MTHEPGPAERFLNRHLAKILVGFMLASAVLVFLGMRYSVHEGWEASCATATENRTFDLDLRTEVIELVGPDTPFAEAMEDNVRKVQEPSPICEKAEVAWWKP